jgi:RNAse (barnase) inhibitor barstar/uncharacterized protein YegP (UPF0339 family)
MPMIRLDDRIRTLEDFYQTLSIVFDLPSYMGKNLDAWRDFLVGDTSEAIQVVWSNWQTVQQNLGMEQFRRIYLFFKACQHERPELFMYFVNNHDDKSKNIYQFEEGSAKGFASDMTAYFEFNRDDQGYYLDLVEADGTLLVHGEYFKNAHELSKQLESLRTSLKDQEFIVFRTTESGRRFFELQRPKERVMASSAVYPSLESLQHAINIALDCVASASLIRLC